MLDGLVIDVTKASFARLRRDDFLDFSEQAADNTLNEVVLLFLSSSSVDKLYRIVQLDC